MSETKGKPATTRRRNTAKPKSAPKTQQKAVKRKEEEMTADELILKAWEKTYANRRRRLDA